jgi:hypothetical protein
LPLIGGLRGFGLFGGASTLPTTRPQASAFVALRMSKTPNTNANFFFISPPRWQKLQFWLLLSAYRKGFGCLFEMGVLGQDNLM